MNRDPRFRDAMPKRRISRRQQLNLMSALVQPTQRQPRLALPAPPFALQIYIQHPHGVFVPAARSSASTSFPSFLNFSQVPRAAIREISQPR
jgi:hypothetical protein